MGRPTWNTAIGSLGYSASPKRAFFPGSEVDLFLTAFSKNFSPSYSMASGSLPPGLTFDEVMGQITGTITPAVAIDTITFDGSTKTFALARTSTSTLDKITFDCTDTYDLTTSGSTDTLDSPYFMGNNSTFYLTQNGMMDDYTPADPQFLTVVVLSLIHI